MFQLLEMLCRPENKSSLYKKKPMTYNAVYPSFPPNPRAVYPRFSSYFPTNAGTCYRVPGYYGPRIVCRSAQFRPSTRGRCVQDFLNFTDTPWSRQSCCERYGVGCPLGM